MAISEELTADYCAYHAYSITPTDSTDISPHSRALYIGTGGNLTVTLVEDTTSVQFVNVPNGTFMPIQVAIVWNTGTTASDIIGLI